jgi:hypothetical protein
VIFPWDGRRPEAFRLSSRKTVGFAERNENPGRCFRESRRRPRAQSKLLIQEQLPKGKVGKARNPFVIFKKKCYEKKWHSGLMNS